MYSRLYCRLFRCRIHNLILMITLLLSTSLINQSKNALASSIATATPEATEAALEMLRHGGNAVDAAVAATLVLNVTVPYKTGIGGGGFLLVHKKNKTTFFNHRESAPASANPKMFLDESGTPIRYFPERITGPNPVGVPGVLLGLWQAHQKFGKLPWKKLFEPAIRLAKKGFPIHRKFIDEFDLNWKRMSVFPATVALFGDESGKPLKLGRNLIQLDLAKTFEQIAVKGAKEFYTGVLAKSWVGEAQKLGVKITLADLKKYKVDTTNSLTFKVFDLDGYTVPPPSAAGFNVIAVLRFLENYYKDHKLEKPDSAKRVIVDLESQKYFQVLSKQHIGDPPHNTLNPAEFYNSESEKKAWEKIKKNIDDKLNIIHAQNLTEPKEVETSESSIQSPPQPGPEHSSTSQVSIIDNQGLTVSYTSTIEYLFGSGMVVPKHGFLLNNEISDFDALPGNPNSAAPGKRPRSNMSPLILTQKNQTVAVAGCAGGPAIPHTITEVLTNYYLYKMSARAANAYPRFYPQSDGVLIEAAYPEETLQVLKTAGYNVNVVQTIWSASDILMRRSLKEPWESSTDPRYDGMAITIN